MTQKLRAYYHLTKPGIIRGNVMAAVAGYLVASAWRIDIGVLLATMFGTVFVIAGSCVANNIIDRNIDKVMKRTKHRALASGVISVHAAAWYASALLLLGFSMLAAWTNWLVVLIGLAGVVFYVVVYGWAKRRTSHGTLIGTISGSAPLVAGYVAARGEFDIGAWLLALVMVAWQMPHFYAIGLRRSAEYRAAGIPVLPVVKGVRRTELEIIGYIMLFTVAIVLLSLFGYTGTVFVAVMVPLSLYWLWRAVGGLARSDALKWGGQMFGLSLVVLLTLSVALSVGSVLP